MGRAFQNDVDRLRVLKQLKYFLEFTQESVSHPAGAVLSRTMWTCCAFEAAEVRLEFTQDWAVLSRTMWTFCAC